MGFPSGVQTVVLTGRVAAADGAADRDTITITQSPERVVSATYDFISERKDITIIPDRATGTWSVRLLAVDAATFDPAGWTYEVQIGASTPFSISLPAGTSPVDLADKTPVSADPGVYTLLVPLAEVEAYADAGDAATLAAANAYTDAHAGGGSSPWVFDIEHYGAVGDAQAVHDGAIVGGTAAVVCATSAPFVSGDVGKSILIKGAGTTGAASFRSTITGRTSSSRVTLADTPPTSITGAVVVWGTNNYTAVRAATTAAEQYLQGTGTGAAATPHTTARVYVPPRPYVIDGPLDTSKSGNGQITFGVYATDQVKKIIEFCGESDGAAAVRHWLQQVPQFAGSCLVSFGFYSSTSTQLTDLNANGNPGVICGPNEGTGNGQPYGAVVGGVALYSNVMAVLKNLAVLTPYTHDGIAYGGFNLYGCANALLENFGTSTMGIVADPSTDYANPATFSAGLSVAGLLPSAGNNDLSVVRNLSVGGGYTYGLFLTEHTFVDRYMALYCWAGLCPVGNYAGSVGASHAMKVVQASIEACTHELYIIGAAAQGQGPIIDIDQLQTESGSPNVDGNSTGALMAALGRVKLTGLYTQGGVSFAQPCGIELVDGGVPQAIRRVTGSFTARPIDRTLVCDTAGGGFTGTLPDADVNPVTYVFKNVGSNSLTVGTTSSQLIYTTSGTGATTGTVATGGTLRVQAMYNGTAWGWYAV